MLLDLPYTYWDIDLHSAGLNQSGPVILKHDDSLNSEDESSFIFPPCLDCVLH